MVLKLTNDASLVQAVEQLLIKLEVK
jgi:hypothetical protein